MQLRHSLVLKISWFQFRSTTLKSWSSQMASFHSTPTCLAKWKNKFSYDEGDQRPSKDGGDQRPSKMYIRYAARQHRADRKKVLNNLLSGHNIRGSKISFEGKFPGMERWDDNQADDSDSGHQKNQSKTSARRSIRSRFKKLKRKLKKDNAGEDFEDYPRRQFQATFGNKWYTWFYREREESTSQSSTGFEWRENPNWTSRGNNRRAHESDEESDTESYFVGSCTDRTLLGLPPRGPLKIEDVKNAFRLSALKWHPDKHQGPFQAVAEEKFKNCVAAYKSLCSALS